MTRWIVALMVLFPIAAIGVVVMFAEGVAPTARMHSDAGADPACRAAVLTGLDTLRRDLGLLSEFGPADVDAIVGAGQLDSSYPRDGVRHTVSFGLDRDTAGGCSLRMWATREKTPGGSRSRAGNFGSTPLPGCRCE